MNADLKTTATNIRKKIVETGFKYGFAHFGGALSCADLLTVVFAKMKESSAKDRFILSKGHSALALYATLNEYGFITDEELASYNANGGYFPTHCVRCPEKGIEISSGSLGLGLSVADGMAVAFKKKKEATRIYVLAGNGEANEGSFWEAVMFAGSKKMDNICLIIDNNQLQNDGFSENVLQLNNFKEKLSAFGWETVEINGHNIASIEAALDTIHPEKPIAVIAETVKGKGVSFMENTPQWHHNKMDKEQLEIALADLEKEEA